MCLEAETTPDATWIVGEHRHPQHQSTVDERQCRRRIVAAAKPHAEGEERGRHAVVEHRMLPGADRLRGNQFVRIRHHWVLHGDPRCVVYEHVDEIMRTDSTCSSWPELALLLVSPARVDEVELLPFSRRPVIST